jgi:hypothetical protein
MPFNTGRSGKIAMKSNSASGAIRSEKLAKRAPGLAYASRTSRTFCSDIAHSVSLDGVLLSVQWGYPVWLTQATTLFGAS